MWWSFLRAHVLPLLYTNVVPSPPLSSSTVATPALSKKRSLSTCLDRPDIPAQLCFRSVLSH
ncbi:unnamed protein product [Fusarium graminearum]|nr:unnamed protein product [Fusarium graminearum]